MERVEGRGRRERLTCGRLMAALVASWIFLRVSARKSKPHTHTRWEGGGEVGERGTSGAIRMVS